MASDIRVLVVDDEKEILESLKELLEDEGYYTYTAQNSAQALQVLRKGADLLLLDIKLGPENGLDVLRSVKSEFPNLPVIMITGHGNVQAAVEAFKNDAYDFLEKPLRLIQVRTAVRNAAEKVELGRKLLEKNMAGAEKPVYVSKIMADLFTQCGKLSTVSEPVSILGPSGSGKELVAKALHFSGPRAGKPFLATNAASMPVSLAESELFGHERGAFTGADRKRKGCIEEAADGTLFIDEIGDMDPMIQAKMLRFLEEGVFCRLGSSAPINSKARIICATHKNIPQLIEKGEFRHDLWYRLSAFIIKVPPLNERKEDIPLLAEKFLEKANLETGSRKKFSEDAISALKDTDFPGNVRELKNFVSRLCLFSREELITAKTVNDNSRDNPQPSRGIINEKWPDNFSDARREFEKRFLKKALGDSDNNISAAAGAIGMAQSNLSRKLKELGLR